MPGTSLRSGARSRTVHQRPRLTAPPSPVLEVVGVTARAPGGRVLLDDVSFAVQRGWLVAVVGPTGAGKTSLARALTGALSLESGAVRLDGVDLATAPPRDRDRIGFVPQDDVLHGELSLRRTLSYAASLRVPAEAGPGERDRRVDAALRELGLEHHTGVSVASLSGGQRKRANIAAELVGRPEVLVLDEPTSGLDPGYEKAVMSTLRQLADGGRTVIAVTHSMAALEHCDRVLFLAEGGRMAYFGPPAAAAAYFGQDDAADVFLALDTEPGARWQERFRAHPAYERYVTPLLQAAARLGERAGPAGAAPAPGDGCGDDLASGALRHRPGWFGQLGTLLRRQAALLRSDRRHLALLLLQAPVLGVLLWLVMRPDSLGLMPDGARQTPGSETVAMFVALSATWLGASNAAREIVKERHILRREVAAGLRPSAYVASKAIVLGALAVLQSAVLAGIACLGQSPPAAGAVLPWGRLELVAGVAAVGLAASGLGLLISAAARTPDKALALLPVTLVAQLALAGRWAAEVDTPGLDLVRGVTGAHWGVEAFAGTLVGDRMSWLHAMAVLGALTASSLAVAAAMVRRHTRPVPVPRALPERLDGLRAAGQRGSTVVAAGAAGVLMAAVAVVAGGAGEGDGGPGTPAVARPPAEVELAAPPTEVTPAATPLTTPPVEAPPEVPPAAPALPTVSPVATAPSAPAQDPDPTTTTAPPEPTTTTTLAIVTPTTAAPAPAGGGVTPASSRLAWWSPWFWLDWVASMGR